LSINKFYLELIYVGFQVDMYSLGVIFFELWYPFSTAMERHLVLSDLKQKGDSPLSWATQFPGQSNLLRRLLSPSPSDRPSAVELLQNDLPPRMEDEWLTGKFISFLEYYFISS
jgi:translation initiation factor 2-alpha kinase 4